MMPANSRGWRLVTVNPFFLPEICPKFWLAVKNAVVPIEQVKIKMMQALYGVLELSDAHAMFWQSRPTH